MAFGAALGAEAFGPGLFHMLRVWVLFLLRHLRMAFQAAHFSMGRGVEALGLYQPASLDGPRHGHQPHKNRQHNNQVFQSIAH